VGKGGRPDASGQVSLDASIMLSPARRGGVAYIRRFEHAISIARAVMERTPHVLLAGEGAEQFALQQNFKPTDLLTDEARQQFEEWRATGNVQPAHPKPIRNIEEKPHPSHDTIGVLALDSNGVLAGGCTTSGMAYKLPGRVGDSPIIGHALY